MAVINREIFRVLITDEYTSSMLWNSITLNSTGNTKCVLVFDKSHQKETRAQRDIRDIRILSSIFILYFLLSIDFYLRFLRTIKVSTFTYQVTFKLSRFTHSFSSYRGSKRFLFQANAFNVLKLIYDSLAKKCDLSLKNKFYLFA